MSGTSTCESEDGFFHGRTMSDVARNKMRNYKDDGDARRCDGTQHDATSYPDGRAGGTGPGWRAGVDITAPLPSRRTLVRYDYWHGRAWHRMALACPPLQDFRRTRILSVKSSWKI